MSSLRRNITANLLGKVWASALGLVFPPIYARLLGIESYGLVGVWTSLTAVLSILDLGLSTTLTREMARHSTDDDDPKAQGEMRDVVRTIECVFWAVGAAAGVVVVFLAPLISNHWVNAQRLSGDVVTSSIRVMGIAFALQWPMGIYNGGLLGLQRQVTANIIQALFVGIRMAGALVLVWKISTSIHVFFIWQAAVAAAQTIVTKVALAKNLPGRARRGTFRWSLLAVNWRFSAGMFVISILSILLTQADKLIVSKLLTLAQFGYYTLAWAVGGALGNLITPVFVAVFPRLSQLVKQRDFKELSRVYHTSCQIISVVVLPAAAVMALFPREVLIAWSGDPGLVALASPVVSIVAIGTALNGLMHVPYALQLAFGWTRLNVTTNLAAIIFIVPLEYWLARRYGMVGAAMGAVILNAAYVIVLIPVMHTRLLRGEQWRWYLVDVGAPLLAMMAVIVPLRLMTSPPPGRLAAFGFLLAVGIATMTAACATAPALRVWGRTLLERGRAPRPMI